MALQSEDKCIQVGLEHNVFLYESQLEKIDAKYNAQRNLDVEQVRRNFEGRISHLRVEIEEEIYSDYCKKLEAFKRNTLSEMRNEIDLSANAKVKEKQLQLEEVYAIRKAALDEREKHLNEVMAKLRETNERTGLFQRQTLAAEMETCRIQAQKVRQVEADLERQRKELRDDFCRRRAQLQTEEQELLARKQEFDNIIKQEVERLRKTDEVELLTKRKELELAETRLTIEKNALEAQKDHILALQEEVSQKSALFSQMEMTDYKTLQLKLSASANEINTLKESLGQALKEIEGLRQDAVTAASKRNLLVATRQENESLRAALEQERTNNNKERINLNVKIEELRDDKSRLEERVRLQESEVSRLRGRLVDQRRTRPLDSHVFPATAMSASTVLLGVKGEFCSESQTPAVSTKTVSTVASSATVETARERLKALEQESVKLEQAIGRWREEISNVPPIPKATTEAVAKLVQPNVSTLLRSGLSTAYLNSFRTASSIPSLGQFPPSWPVPFMRSMASAIEAARDGTCGETPEPVNIHQHFGREASTSVQQPQMLQTSGEKNPLQEGTIPRATTPVATTPSVDNPMNCQKERKSSANHGSDTPLMITSQGIDQGIERSEVVHSAGSDGQTSCQSAEQTHKTCGCTSDSSEHSISDPLTDDVDDDCSNGSRDKQVDTDRISEEAEKRFVGVSPHGSQKEEEEKTRFDLSLSLGIDPMILKYIEAPQEQRPAKELEVKPTRPIVTENQGPDATKTRPSFGDFLSAQQFDSDLSSTERKFGDISTGEPIEEKSEEYNTSDNFW
ncbi:hypothetical protein TcWFU_008926 [Taenia crassiceps]|uniref:Oral-facial-digital syndrome 1 protein n=1 Tax=Taenia crassiceps TaxID=6207 RepID=A0ABR4QIV5_9CEST